MVLNEFQAKKLLKQIGKKSLDEIIIMDNECMEFDDEPIEYVAMERITNGKVWIFELTPKGIKNLIEVPQ